MDGVIEIRPRWVRGAGGEREPPPCYDARAIACTIQTGAGETPKRRRVGQAGPSPVEAYP
jgi:hypothetical protein